MSDGDAAPALFHHCVSTYEAMLNEADIVALDNTVKGMVYEGFLTELFKSTLHLSVPYYTKVTQALKGMGCVKQLRRGGSSTPSQWHLVKDPNLEQFEEWLAIAKAPVVYLTEEDVAPLKQQIQDLNRRLQSIETIFQNATPAK